MDYKVMLCNTFAQWLANIVFALFIWDMGLSKELGVAIVMSMVDSWEK